MTKQQYEQLKQAAIAAFFLPIIDNALLICGYLFAVLGWTIWCQIIHCIIWEFPFMVVRWWPPNRKA